MNKEYNRKVSSKNSKQLLKNLQNTTRPGLLFCRTLYVVSWGCYVAPPGEYIWLTFSIFTARQHGLVCRALY